MKLKFKFILPILVIVLLVAQGVSFADISIKRYAGADRFQTAINISKETITTSKYAVIASGEDFPDALSSTSLANVLNAPVFLVRQHSLPDGLSAELNRIQAKEIYILGGVEAVGESVENQLKQSFTVKRIGGKDRIETSELVAKEAVQNGAKKFAIVSNAYSFGDAISAVNYIVKNDAVFLLTDKNSVQFSDSWKNEGYTFAIVGGPAALSNTIESSLSATRYSGSNRYETSNVLAKAMYGSISKAILVTGKNYSDGLASVSLSKKQEAPIILLSPTSTPSSTKDLLKDTSSVYVCGGQHALPELSVLLATGQVTRVSSAVKRVQITYDGSVNVRIRPWGDVIGSTTTGKIHPVHGVYKDKDNDTWYYVKINNQYGFLHSSVLKTLKETTSVEKFKITYDGSVNLRTEPWGKIVDSCYTGDIFTILGSKKDSDGRIWYQIEKGGRKLYVYGDLGIKFTQDIPSLPSNAVGEVKVRYSEGVNVRAKPWGEILGLAGNGTVMPYYKTEKASDGSTWYLVKFKEKPGYVHSNYVKILGNENGNWVKQNGKLRVNHYSINVRDDAWGTILGSVSDLTVHDYDYYQVDKSGVRWYRINFNGRKGWVYGGYVEIGTPKVTGVHVVLSTAAYTGDQIGVQINTHGTKRSKSRLYVDGKLIGDFTTSNHFVWKPSGAKKYTFKVEATDVLSSGVDKVHTQEITLKGSDYYPATYSVDFFGMTLDEFTNVQVGRNTVWRNGAWQQAGSGEIKGELNPDNIMPFAYKLKHTSRDTATITDSVNFRKVPGGEIYAMCSPGERYAVLGYRKYYSDLYYHIERKGKRGYIHSDYAKLTYDTSETKSVGRFVKTIKQTSLKSAPNGSNLSTLNSGLIYHVEGYDGQYVKVTANGKQGWVYRNHVIGTDQVSPNMYQFLDLRGSAGVSENELNNLLKGKGILDGKASSFIQASKQYKINEIYLVSHAILETGNGFSDLATGLYYTTPSGKKVKVYNMYGIGAYDSDPINGGKKTAYEEGWTTPEKAIIGGAKWINAQYINHSSGQNTLYKMKWNYVLPWHQYATDIGWARKQTDRIMDLYTNLNQYKMHFIIPQYK